MKEVKQGRKELIKTAAIIFLAVMLVLTFFSNTIMNYSLPEVAAQYIQPGSITAQIRGTGMVESGDPYKVKVDGVRKVESIEVNVGDVVAKGDILMNLSYEDSVALTEAKNALELAQKDYDTAILNSEVAVSVMQSAGETQSSSVYQDKVIALKNAVSAAEKDVETAQEKVDELTRWGEALRTQLSVTHVDGSDTSAEQAAADEAKAQRDAAKEAKDAAKETLDAAKNSLAETPDDEALQAAVEEAQNVYDAAEKSYKELKSAYEKAANKLKNKQDTINTYASLNSQLDTNTVDVFHARNDLADKEEVLKDRQDALNEYITNVYDSMSLKILYQKVEEAKKAVADLQKEMDGGVITSPINGTITAINVTSGLDTPADGIVMTMQPEGKGYTMSFSVTNEQARKVTVGEKASLVNSWRYDNLEVVLTRIMPDTTNPSQQKLLVFEVSGENVIPGQSINVSVGQKTGNFDMIVPNSAIREDNNGKFILIVESKNSPLGNRYIATRVDVEVIASDDTKSAITGAVYGYEFVITTSTQPIQAGQYVRLSNN